MPSPGRERFALLSLHDRVYWSWPVGRGGLVCVSVRVGVDARVGGWVDGWGRPPSPQLKHQSSCSSRSAAFTPGVRCSFFFCCIRRRTYCNPPPYEMESCQPKPQHTHSHAYHMKLSCWAIGPARALGSTSLLQVQCAQTENVPHDKAERT